eukprot:4411976-Prorocentrum_lima.AAC.1
MIGGWSRSVGRREILCCRQRAHTTARDKTNDRSVLCLHVLLPTEPADVFAAQPSTNPGIHVV